MQEDIIETNLERKDKLKKKILTHLHLKSKDTSENPHNFTLSGISVGIAGNYDLDEIETAIDQLSDPNQDNKLTRLKFETDVFVPKSDQTFYNKFKNYLKAPGIVLLGVSLLTILILYEPFNLFSGSIDPDSAKGGFVLGLWIMAIFGRLIGDFVSENYSILVGKISEISNIKKKSIMVISGTTLLLFIIFFLIIIFMNNTPIEEIPAWELVGVFVGGIAVGAIIDSTLFAKTG